MNILRLLIVVVILLTPPGWAISYAPNAGTRGLERLCVHFYVLDETPVSEFDSGIAADLVGQLAELGLPAVDFTRCSQPSSTSGDLLITVRGAPSASGKFWAYDVSLELMQQATLDRDPTQKLSSGVATYRNVTVGVATKEQLTKAVRTAGLELARSFAQLYWTENPKG